MAKETTATRQRQQTQAPQHAPRENLPATQPPKQQANPLVAFKQHLDERMGELQFALPAHITPERFQRVALTALQRNNKLLACTKQSLWNACLLAAQDGLLPDGREGAIVPYGTNADGKKQADIATWMPMIEGLRKKARNSGEILNWEVHAVRARDHFRFALGDDAFIEHEPYFGPGDPGGLIGVYSIATLKDGIKSRDVMTAHDVMKIKAKSSASKGPWSDPDFFNEMAKKTVARRHYKQLPHSSDLDDIMRRDDEAFGLDDRSEAQIEQRQQRRIGSTAAAFEQFAGNGSTAFIEHQADDQTDDGAFDQETGEATGAFGGDDNAADGIADGATDTQQVDRQAQHGSKETQQQTPTPTTQTDKQNTGLRGGSRASAAAADKVVEADGAVSKDRDGPTDLSGAQDEVATAEDDPSAYSFTQSLTLNWARTAVAVSIIGGVDFGLVLGGGFLEGEAGYTIVSTRTRYLIVGSTVSDWNAAAQLSNPAAECTITASA
ncbi:recombinase RecT [Bradyrhizobium sp. SYSU BS000235]|uniref:recombinase RecT n=1 Tax=Bradyrhizobium sp. SYSU BS000235 TaxID=3411332 RepID=UPI003C77D5CE